MESPKKRRARSPPAGSPPPPGESADKSRDDGRPEDFGAGLSALQLFDFALRRWRTGAPPPPQLHLVRACIAELEEIQDEARAALEQYEAALTKLRSPALRLGTLLHRLEGGRALVCSAGTDFVCALDPQLPEALLESGVRVLLNEAYAVVDVLGVDRGGPVVRIAEVLADGRLRVGHEHGTQDLLVARSSLLAKDRLKAGLDVRLDPHQRVAVEVVSAPRRIARGVEPIPPTPWEAVGGQAEAVQAIRETIELPFLHRGLFREFAAPVPKGFLLHGPPGCGKTLLGRATAWNLRRQLRERTGVDRPEFFLSVKGPEVLTMWLGETERQVRELFAQCREKAAEGHLSFLFIDEAESVLGTRQAFRAGSSILSTLVPTFCTEMDGLEALQDVVVILASNRADLIDPAILRPGRIDRKIRVRRPDEAAARQIYAIHLQPELPLAEPREALLDFVSARHYAQTEETRFLEIAYRSGRRDFLHRGELASGALIAGVVRRAKEAAIRRSAAAGATSPLRRDDLAAALDQEYRENDLFPPTDITEDWLKLTDLEPENVVRLSPVRAARAGPPHVVV